MQEFKTLYEQYRINHENVPLKMHAKLIYIAEAVIGNVNNKVASELDESERQQLDEMDKNNKRMLFVSVVNCLLGKEAVDFVQNKQVFIKKDRTFSIWRISYLTYDSEKLYVSRDGDKMTYKLNKLKISDGLRKINNIRYAFLLVTRQYNYLVALDDRKMIGQLHSRLVSLIVTSREKSKIRQVREETTQSSAMRESRLEQQKLAQPDLRQNSRIIEMDKNPLIDEFELENLEDQSEFRVFQNNQHSRILQHCKQYNRFKLFILVDTTNSALDDILENVFNVKEWNIEVEEYKIINKIQNNMYAIYEKYKPYSYTSWNRDFVMLKSALKYKNNLYLCEKSIEHKQYPLYNTTVRGNLKKSTAFIGNGTKYTLIITQFEADFAGRNSTEDNKLMALRILRCYDKLPSYCIQKSLMERSRRMFCFQEEGLFEIKPQICETIQTRAQLNINRQSILEPTQIKNKKQSQTVLLDLLQTYLEDKVSNQIFKHLNNNQHYIIPLKHLHIQKSRLPGLRHCDKGPSEFVYQGGDWKLNTKKQLIFVNQQVIDAQKDVLKFIFKQIGTNILTGKSIMNMSLPVQIFDSRSILQRSAASFGYAPILLTNAGRINDDIEQMKIVSTYLISIVLLQLRIEKPFNPILGQTFQGYLGGIPICYEQISHHPPISSYYCECNEFLLTGNIVSMAEMGLNSCLGYNPGVMKIYFKNTKSTFEVYIPVAEVGGLLYGERYLRLIHKAYVLNRQKNTFCQIFFGKDKRDLYPSETPVHSFEFNGGIYKVKPQFVTRFLEEKKKYKFHGLTVKDVIEQKSRLSGNWLDKVMFDEKIYFQPYTELPYRLEYQKYPLASNSNYRQDILYKRIGDLNMAQETKQKLEQLQRYDRKLREKMGKKH